MSEQTQTQYHIFADMLDDFTLNFQEAKKTYRDLVGRGFPRVRLYREVVEIESQIVVRESCIAAHGDYPL